MFNQNAHEQFLLAKQPRREGARIASKQTTNPQERWRVNAYPMIMTETPHAYESCDLQWPPRLPIGT